MLEIEFSPETTIVLILFVGLSSFHCLSREVKKLPKHKEELRAILGKEEVLNVIFLKYRYDKRNYTLV